MKDSWRSFRLADTSIRMYRRKDGRVSLRLRSYLMVPTTVGFSLSAYLREISCYVTLPTGKRIEFDEILFSSATLAYALDTMLHTFSAGAVADMDIVEDTVGMFRMEYLISFTGHPAETEPQCFELEVPLIRKRSVCGVR